MYEKSPPFLKPEGKYISLVGGKTHGILPVLKNNLWPKFLWGTPRTYKILGLAPAGEYMREVVKLVEQGVIKKVPIDSEYSMEQAVEVGTASACGELNCLLTFVAGLRESHDQEGQGQGCRQGRAVAGCHASSQSEYSVALCVTVCEGAKEFICPVGLQGGYVE